MATLQERILQNVRAGTGPCNGCPARGECLHVGFFNYDADVLVVGHEPSLSHFDYDAYDIEKSIDWYHEFYEASGRIESWGFYDFLAELFGPLGIDSSELPEWIYMTDLVKCPTKEFDDRDWSTAFDHCESYFEQELAEIEPEVILAVGNKSARHALRIHGVPDDEAKRTHVTKDYGLSPHDTSRPIVIVPHWGFFEGTLCDQKTGTNCFRQLPTISDSMSQYGRRSRTEKRPKPTTASCRRPSRRTVQDPQSQIAVD